MPPPPARKREHGGGDVDQERHEGQYACTAARRGRFWQGAHAIDRRAALPLPAHEASVDRSAARYMARKNGSGPIPFTGALKPPAREGVAPISHDPLERR